MKNIGGFNWRRWLSIFFLHARGLTRKYPFNVINRQKMRSNCSAVLLSDRNVVKLPMVEFFLSKSLIGYMQDCDAEARSRCHCKLKIAIKKETSYFHICFKLLYVTTLFHLNCYQQGHAYFQISSNTNQNNSLYPPMHTYRNQTKEEKSQEFRKV